MTLFSNITGGYVGNGRGAILVAILAADYMAIISMGRGAITRAVRRGRNSIWGLSLTN